MVTDTGQRFPEGKFSEEFKIPLPPLLMHILHSLQDVNDFFPLMVVDIFLDQCLNSAADDAEKNMVDGLTSLKE